MSQGQGNYQRAPLPKTALDEYKLRLVSDAPPKGARRPATLAFSVVKNNPRFTLFTNVDTDKDKGRLQAALDTHTLYAFLQLLRKVADGEPGTKFSIENKNHTYFNGQRSTEPKLMSTIIVGKDDEGCVFMGVVANNITPVKFIFGPTEYHMMVHKDGTPFTRAELSVLYAKGYADLLENLTANVLDSHYVEPEPRENNRRGGGGGGNWQSRGNNRGAVHEDAWSDIDVSDDFPM